MKMTSALFILAVQGGGYFTITALLMLGMGALAGVILWDLRYRRVWQQSRAGKWQQSEGRFLSGSVIAMRAGRSEEVVEFEVRMDYQYDAGKRMAGVYRRSVPTREAAEAYLKRLANQRITVRIPNGRVSDSRVLDKDVDALMNRSSSEGE